MPVIRKRITVDNYGYTLHTAGEKPCISGSRGLGV